MLCSLPFERQRPSAAAEAEAEAEASNKLSFAFCCALACGRGVGAIDCLSLSCTCSADCCRFVVAVVLLLLSFQFPTQLQFLWQTISRLRLDFLWFPSSCSTHSPVHCIVLSWPDSHVAVSAPYTLLLPDTLFSVWRKSRRAIDEHVKCMARALANAF